jgi:hypothetical protein
MGTTNATWPAFPHSRLYSRSDSPMTPAVTDTRMPKARTVWTLPSIRFLRSVSSGLPYGRQASWQSRFRGVFNARIGSMSQARTKLRTTVSAHSEERVSRTRALHARSWHSRHRVHNQDGRASPCPWALLSLYSRGHNEASDQDPWANMQVRASHRQSFSQATCAKPLSAQRV